MSQASVSVDIQAKIVGYQQEIEKIKAALKNIRVDSSVGKELTQSLKLAEKEVDNLAKHMNQRFTSDSQITSFTDKMNDVEKRFVHMGQVMSETTFSDLDLSNVDNQFKQLIEEIEATKSSLKEKTELGFSDAVKDSKELQNAFKRLGIDLKDLSSEEVGTILEKSFSNLEESITSATSRLKEIRAEMEELTKKRNELLDKPILKIGDAGAEAQKILGSKEDLGFTSQINEEAFRKFSEKINTVLENAKPEIQEKKEQINEILKNIGDAKTTQEVENNLIRLKAIMQKTGQLKALGLDSQSFDKTAENLFSQIFDESKLDEALGRIRQRLQERGISEEDIQKALPSIKTSLLEDNFKNAQEIIRKNLEATKKETDKAVDDINDKMAELGKEQSSLKSQKGQDVYTKKLVSSAKENYGKIIDELKAKNAELEQRIKALEQTREEKRNDALNKIKGSGQDTQRKGQVGFEENIKGAKMYRTELEQVQAREKLIGKIEGVVQRWFSIYAAVRMVSNAIKSVISTVKELDKTITEIAIVTDMTQDDLWKQMSDYTNMATQYAASISGVYKVSQLYYQQGLQTADVMALTEETLKMARISGLDYAQATDYMTNAVRSFKMEMTDAQRVVDVYSEIAASSATSTAELASAMSKTASSAEAVGSSFENTTAMMAVMIEATRESAENIGSAMKSIISRYGEMKDNPTKLLDSEGEAMSLNKVDKALQSVGISLQDSQHQFRDFDDVITELAGKWDTIDTNTQRYIATVMAGNRQQSRFLALVSNGERLAELSEKAANSQDTATLQMLKTMDSIEAKTQQLTTSLQSLYTSTGIQNLLKGILDFGTSIIQTFTRMPTIFNLPILAIAKFGTQFYSLANVVTTVFSLIKTRLTTQAKLLQGEMTNDAQVGSLTRITIYSEEFQALANKYKTGEIEYEEFQQQLNSLAQKGVDTRNNINKGEKVSGITKGMAKASLALNAAGGAVSLLSSGIKTDTQSQRNTKGLLESAGAAMQGVGMGLMVGGPAGAIVGALTALPGIIGGISTMYESAAEKAERLKKAVEDTNNIYLQRREESRNLEEQIEKLKELEKTQNDSTEAKQEFIELSNQIAEQHPELIKGYDLEGNSLIDLTSSYYALKQAREAANEAAKENAKASVAQADNNLKEAEDNRQAALESYYEKISEGYQSSRVDEIVNKIEENGYKFTDNSPFLNILKSINQSSSSGVIIENLFNNSGEDVYAIQDILEQSFGKGLAEIVEELINSTKELIQPEKISELVDKDNNKVLTESQQNIMGDIEKALLDKNTEKVIQLINDHREQINEMRTTIIDSLGENHWAINYLNNWLEINGEATQAIADAEKVAQMRTSMIKSEISSISSSILTAQKNDIGKEYLRELEGINTFVTQYLTQKFNNSENQDFDSYIAEELDADLEEAQKILLDIWTQLGSSFNRDKFNDLIKNANNYNFSEMHAELRELMPNLSNDNLINLIKGIYGDNLLSNIENFQSAVEQRLREDSGELYQVLKQVNPSQLGQTDLTAILDQYDKLQEMVSSGAITDNLAKELFTIYTTLLDESKTKDSQTREQIQSALQDLDLTSLESVNAFIEVMTELGTLDSETATKLKTAVPVNLNTEINTYIESITSGMNDFESALNKSTQGMNYKDALEMAEKMGVSVSDFRQVGTKFFNNDFNKLKEAYIKTDNDLLTTIEGRITNISAALNEVFKEEEPTEQFLNDEEIKQQITAALESNKANVTADQLNLEGYYKEWSSKDEKTRGDFVKFVVDSWLKVLDEAKEADNFVNTQIAENYLAKGDFSNFLKYLQEAGSISEQQVGDYQKYFDEGNFEELFKIFPQYSDTIISTFKKINQDIYNRMTSGTEIDNWIKRDDTNKDLIEDLSKIGLIEDSVKDQDGNFWYKLGEITEDNIQNYYDTITNDAYLTASEKATERAKATTALWNKSLDRYLQEAFKNTESVSQEVAEQLRTLLELSDEDFNTIFEQNGNNYIVNASELARVAGKSGQEISNETQNMGNEAIQKTTDSIIKEISTATDLLSKGSTSAADIEKFVSDFNKVTEQNLTADQMFSFDETLDTDVLNSEYYQQYLAAKKAEMLQYGATEEQVNNYVDELTEKSLAAAVDINSFLKTDNREEGSQAYNKLAEQMRDFYAKLGYSQKLIDSIVNQRMKNMLSGGNAAVQNLVYWAEKTGTEVSSSDVEQAYRAEISQLENAFDQLSYGVGSLVSGQAVDILEAAGYGIDRIEGTDSAVIKSIGDVADAYEAYYKELKKTNEATVAALNEAYAKVLETRDGSDVIAALGDAASMTYTRLGEILASKGIELTDELLAQYSDAIQSIGGGKVRITNFDKFATEIMGWTDIDKNSEEYISAFKTYNDSLVEMNRKAERNILEEVSKLNDVGAGDWVNLTQLYSKLQEAIVPDWYNGNVNLEKRPRVSAEDLIDKGWYAEIGEKGTINGATYSWDEIKGMPEKMMVSLASITEDGLVKSYDEVKNYLQELINVAGEDGQVDIDELKQLDEENQNLLLDIFISESNDINEAIAEANERAGDLHDRQALFEDFLNEELLEYGAQLENGILQISDEGANIPMIMQTLSDKIQKYGNLSAQEEAELLDTLNANLKGYSDAISNAIKGTASNIEIQKIGDWAKNLGIQIDFTETVDGLKISQQSAIALYHELKKIDYIQSQIVFKELSDSLKENNSNYKDMSSILARIKTLQEEIDSLEPNDARRKKYEEELALAQEIKETRALTDPASFNFMDNDLPDAMKGAENYWNSWSTAFKAMNEAGESGRMGIQDFYNIVNEMNNLAKMSGSTLTFMGRELNGDSKSAANLIQEGMSYLTNIDGEGVSVALKQFGTSFANGATDMQSGVEGGIHAMADANIKMLDAMIGFLELIVAFGEFGEIDTDGKFGLDFSEMFDFSGELDENGNALYGSNEKVKEISGHLLELSESNEDLKKALDGVKINGMSARKALQELNSDNLHTRDEWEKYRKITDILYQAAASGDYSTQNLTQLIKEAFGDSKEVVEVEIYGRKFAVKQGIIIEMDENNNYIVDGKKYDDPKEAFKVKKFQQENELEKTFQNDDGGYSGEFTVDNKYTVTMTATLDEEGNIQGEPTYTVEGESGLTAEQAKDKLFELSGYSSKEEWLKESDIIAKFKMNITDVQAELGAKNIGELSDEILAKLGLDVNLVRSVEAGIERAFQNGQSEIGSAIANGIVTALSNPENFADKEFSIPTANATLDEVLIDNVVHAAFADNTTWLQKLFGQENSDLTIPEAKAKVETLTLMKPNTTNFSEVDEGQTNISIDTVSASVNKLQLGKPTSTDFTAVSEGEKSVDLDTIQASVKTLELGKPSKTDFTAVEDGDKSIHIDTVTASVGKLVLNKPDEVVSSAVEDKNEVDIKTVSADIEELVLSQPKTVDATAVEKKNSVEIETVSASVGNLILADPTSTNSDALVTAATTTGADVTAGLIAGMGDGTNVSTKGTEIGTAVVDAINTAAGTHSPSTITAQTGKDLVQGLVNGLGDSSEAVSAATTVAEQIINAIQTYFDTHPISVSAKVAENNVGENNNNSNNSNTGLSAIQIVISNISAAASTAAKSISDLNEKLEAISDNGANKATDFQSALAAIGDNGKIKAENFQKALAAIGDNGKIKAENFQKALAAISDNGKIKAQNFQAALAKIGNNGAQKATAFGNALARINASGVNYANSFKSALNNISSAGPRNAANFKDALNRMSSNAANAASRFVSAANRMGNNGIKLNLNVNVNVKGSGGAQSTGYNWNGHYSYAKGTEGLALSGGKNTLMGELGPELVVSHGRYFLVGENGPEMVNLDPDAIVFNHLQTQQLIKRGKTNTYGKPITNEQNAVSLANGNFSGSAMATASEVLAALKQLRAMWESLLKASVKDMGINPSRKKTGSNTGSNKGSNNLSDENSETAKAVEGILYNVERWYNWLALIEEKQNKINLLSKEYNLLTGKKERADNLAEQVKNIQVQLETARQLYKEQEAYRKQAAKKMNNGMFGAFYHVDEKTGDIRLNNDKAFADYVRAHGDLQYQTLFDSLILNNGIIKKGSTFTRQMNSDEIAQKQKTELKKSYKDGTKIPEYLQQYYAYDNKSKTYKLIDGQEKAAKQEIANHYSSIYGMKSFSLKRDISSGLDFINELNRTDSAGNAIYSASEQLSMIKALGFYSEDLLKGVDQTQQGWEAQVVQNFFDKIDNDKAEMEALNKSIQEQKEAELEYKKQIQEINQQLSEMARPVEGITDHLESWYNWTVKINNEQHKLNMLTAQYSQLQNRLGDNSAEQLQNLKNQNTEIRAQLNNISGEINQKAQINTAKKSEIENSALNKIYSFDKNGNVVYKSSGARLKNSIASSKIEGNSANFDLTTRYIATDQAGNKKKRFGLLEEYQKRKQKAQSSTPQAQQQKNSGKRAVNNGIEIELSDLPELDLAALPELDLLGSGNSSSNRPQGDPSAYLDSIIGKTINGYKFSDMSEGISKTEYNNAKKLLKSGNVTEDQKKALQSLVAAYTNGVDQFVEKKVVKKLDISDPQKFIDQLTGTKNGVANFTDLQQMEILEQSGFKSAMEQMGKSKGLFDSWATASEEDKIKAAQEYLKYIKETPEEYNKTVQEIQASKEEQEKLKNQILETNNQIRELLKPIDGVLDRLDSWYKYTKQIANAQSELNILTAKYSNLEKTSGDQDKNKAKNLTQQAEQLKIQIDANKEEQKLRKQELNKEQKNIKDSAFGKFLQYDEASNSVIYNTNSLGSANKIKNKTATYVEQNRDAKGAERRYVKGADGKTHALSFEEFKKNHQKGLTSEQLNDAWDKATVASSTKKVQLGSFFSSELKDNKLTPEEVIKKLTQKDANGNAKNSLQKQRSILEALNLTNEMAEIYGQGNWEELNEKQRNEAAEKYLKAIEERPEQINQLKDALKEAEVEGINLQGQILDINNQLKELAEVSAGIQSPFDKWYTWIQKITAKQNELNLLTKKYNVLQKERTANGAEEATNLLKQLNNYEEQQQINSDYLKKRNSNLNTLVGYTKSDGTKVKGTLQKNAALSKFFTYDEENGLQYNQETEAELKELAVQGIQIEKDKKGNYIKDKNGIYSTVDANKIANFKFTGIEDLITQLTKQDSNNKMMYNTDEQFAILKALGLENLMKYDANGNKIFENGIKNATKEERATAVKTLLDNLRNFQDEVGQEYNEVQSLRENSENIESSILDIKQQLLDNEISLENQVLKAIEDREQKQINDLKERKEMLSEAADRFINGLSEQLNKEKSMYETQEKQDELIKMQRQLAILQRSGGSGSQIRSLQEQIRTRQKDMYFNERQQQIDAIKEASDKQIEKLDRQIELAEETLAYNKENGLYWNEVRDIMNKSTSAIVQFLELNLAERRSQSSLQKEQSSIDDSKMVGLYTGSRNKYASGGIIDYTGPAWVDGSYSKPEAILNADQTNFLRHELLDSLNSFSLAINQFTQGALSANTLNMIGDNSGINIEQLDFVMKVDSIGNDYDAKRAGQQAFEEMVRIARKAGNHSVSRR